MKNLEVVQDQVIANLTLPYPCPIKIIFVDGQLHLHVGQRDWQWDLETGRSVGSGTRLVKPRGKTHGPNK